MEKEDWVHLDTATCVQEYGQWFVSGRADVIPVFTSASTSIYLNASLHASFNVTPIVHADTENHFVKPPYMWMCIMGFDGAQGGLTDCTPTTRQNVYGDNFVGFDSKTGQWNIVTYTDNGANSADVVEVDYCLSRREPENCKLSFSVSIMYTIIALNAFKAACMLATLYAQKIPTLVTLGGVFVPLENRTSIILIPRRCYIQLLDGSGTPYCRPLPPRAQVEDTTSAGVDIGSFTS